MALKARKISDYEGENIEELCTDNLGDYQQLFDANAFDYDIAPHMLQEEVGSFEPVLYVKVFAHTNLCQRGGRARSHFATEQNSIVNTTNKHHLCANRHWHCVKYE